MYTYLLILHGLTNFQGKQGPQGIPGPMGFNGTEVRELQL